MAYRFGLCLPLVLACHSKGLSPQPGQCLAAPSSAVGADLVYPARDPSVARGSASDPLPIVRAIERPLGDGCVDGEGALWIATWSSLRRYDATLVLTLEAELGIDPQHGDVGPPACDEHGVWVVLASGSMGAWTLRVARYTKDGLAEEHALTSSTPANSIRLGGNGPLLVFQDWSPKINGVTYTPPDATAGWNAVYRLFPAAELARLVWIRGRFVVDADGSFLSVEEVFNTSNLRFTRYGADGALATSREISGELYPSVSAPTATPQGYLVLAGRGGGDIATPVSPDKNAAFLLALDRDGNVVWLKRFLSPGDLRLAGLEIAANRLWLFGQFGEWIESDGAAAFGHTGRVVDARYVSTGWEHRFVAVVDSAGSLGLLEPLGVSFAGQFTIVPVDGAHAYMLGWAAERESDPTQVGLAGPLPLRFLGTLDLSGRSPAAMPSQPDETLARLSLPQGLGRIVQVRSSHDGNAYVVIDQDRNLTFVDTPSRQVLPAFRPPNDEMYLWSYERLGNDIFTFDDETHALRHFRLGESGWSEMSELISGGSTSDYYCSAPLPSGDWLFSACATSVIGLRRQGDTWVPATRSEAGGGSALDTDGTFLVVGDRLAKGLRKDEGVVRVYPITPEGLGQPELLKPSDPLPYDPGDSTSDYMPGPPPGRGFGRHVHLEGHWLLVGDDEGSYGFEHAGGRWQERWKQLHAGSGALLGGALYVFDPYEARGLTRDAGAIHVWQRSDGVWTERQRVVTGQRWPAMLGHSFARMVDGLLVAAPGYEWSDGSASGDDGAVFSILFGACPKAP